VGFFGKRWGFVGIVSLIVSICAVSAPQAQERILISYGGFNETVGPMWVAVDKGLFKKYRLDVGMLQVAQLDIHQIINGSFVKSLEETGFLPEARKRQG
jgi:ABC-type nitrate/sulfonate/bicarbonate transport system substrate-binding protein